MNPPSSHRTTRSRIAPSESRNGGRFSADPIHCSSRRDAGNPKSGECASNEEPAVRLPTPVLTESGSTVTRLPSRSQPGGIPGTRCRTSGSSRATLAQALSRSRAESPYVVGAIVQGAVSPPRRSMLSGVAADAGLEAKLEFRPGRMMPADRPALDDRESWIGQVWRPRDGHKSALRASSKLDLRLSRSGFEAVNTDGETPTQFHLLGHCSEREKRDRGNPVDRGHDHNGRAILESQPANRPVTRVPRAETAATTARRAIEISVPRARPYLGRRDVLRRRLLRWPDRLRSMTPDSPG